MLRKQRGAFIPRPTAWWNMIADLIHTPSSHYHGDSETLRIPQSLLRGRRSAVATGRAPRQTPTLSLSRPTASSCTGTGPKTRLTALDRALAADLFATSIANGAFGLLLLNPPYDWDSADKRVEHAFLTHCTRYLADGGLLVFIVPPAAARGLGPLPVHALRQNAVLGLPPTPSARSSIRWCCSGYRKTDPVPEAHAEKRVLEWAFGEPELLPFVPPTRSSALPTNAERRHPVHHPDSRPGRGCG